MTKAANGRSSIYRDANGIWHGWVSFGVTPDGRRRRKHIQASTKREVAEKVSKLERMRDSGYQGNRPLTIAEWLNTWIIGREISRVRSNTINGYRIDQRHIVASIGQIRLDRLTPEHIDGLWQSILASGPGPATCAHVKRTLSAALNTAVDHGHMTRNPARLSKAPRYEPPEIEPLTTSEARDVLGAAANRRNAARWSVALALGLRQGEALGLRWSDVDLDVRRLIVRIQLQHLAWQHGCLDQAGEIRCGKDPGRCPTRHGGGPVLVPVKSSAGRRVLSLPAPMVGQLIQHKIVQESERERAANRWHETNLVFVREDGSPIRKETDSAEWHNILKIADVRPARLHDARHTAATLLLVQGVPAGVAMRLLGHSDTRITSRYQHVVEESSRAAADQVSAALWGVL